jgi:hypothetical protein
LLAAILGKVPETLGKPELELITTAFLRYLPQDHRNVLAARHKTDEKAKHDLGLKAIDAAGLAKLLVEASLIDAASNPYASDGGTLLASVAKRYRVNVDQIKQTVAKEFSARARAREKKQAAKVGGKSRGKAKPSPKA